MIDNINGFVPHSPDSDPGVNGHQPDEMAERDVLAHYSPMSGLSGGPVAPLDTVPMGSTEEPAGDDVNPDEPVGSIQPVADIKPEPSQEAQAEVSDQPIAIEEVLDGEPQPVASEPESDSIATGPEGDGLVEEEVVEPAVAGELTDVSAVTDGAEAVQESLEPDPTQPLPVGRPPSPLELDAQVESLLFVADGPAQVGKMAEALEVKADQIEAALALLEERYAGRGISIQRIKDRVQLTTSATAAPLIQRFLGLSATAPLSKAALETLAIIAYRQPITRPQIEQIRGVNSDSVIKNLLTKGLVEETGIAEGPGRPVLYATTPEFLQHFGLSALAELPALNLDEVRRQFASDILKG